MATLVSLPEVERLSNLVIRVLGGNPGKFTLQGTNTYLVGRGPTRLLIDTGEGKSAWTQSLKSILAAEQATVEHAILTHWHPDHVGGVPDLLKCCPGAKVYKHQPSATQLEIANGQIFQASGATLRAFHCPGHTTDHMAFVLEEEDAMFTGDNVLGHGTAVFEDLGAYVKSLKGMAEQFHGRAYPGHGAVIEDGHSKVIEYIQHREERERQILDVLGSGGSQMRSSMDIVKIIYKDYPENLHLPAEGSVLQVLNKLQRDGVVENDASTNLWSLKRREAAL